jgi:hypothetical protein
LIPIPSLMRKHGEPFQVPTPQGFRTRGVVDAQSPLWAYRSQWRNSLPSDRLKGNAITLPITPGPTDSEMDSVSSQHFG